MTVDARTLREPIVCTLEEIVEPHGTKAIRGLQDTATRNANERNELVRTLVNLASGGRRVRANENRRMNAHGR
jgi:hypothetical protein